MLNRNLVTVEGADYFLDKKRDVLVEEFRQVVISHTHLIGNSVVKVLQGMSDRSVDLLLEYYRNMA